MHVHFYEFNSIDDDQLKYAVILARYNNEWIFVRHKDRQTWEIPGGRRERNESIEETARRELYEETGAKAYHLDPLYIYSVTHDSGDESYGGLFYSEVSELGSLPLESEIGQVSCMKELPNNWTYPLIQPELLDKGLKKLCLTGLKQEMRANGEL